MTKNVIDYYQDWYDEDIRDDLTPSRLPLVVVCENISGDFNKSCVLRTAEGFNLSEFWLLGDKKMDMRGTVGAHHRLPVKHSDSIYNFLRNDLDLLKLGYRFVALDNVDGAIPIQEYQWERNSVLFVGEEQRGLSQNTLDTADDTVYIPMRGAVRSFNVATAAGMAMFDYVSKMGG